MKKWDHFSSNRQGSTLGQDHFTWEMQNTFTLRIAILTFYNGYNILRKEYLMIFTTAITITTIKSDKSDKSDYSDRVR